jgi:UDP-GlcNAc3NAcA epimerase
MDRPLRLLTIIGARPQIIKAAALSRAVRGPYKGQLEETLLHTGQHYDANMSQVFFDELGIPAADINLHTGSGQHGATTARMIEGIEQVLLRREHDVVVLYGDTNSTLAGALAASKLQVPVAHIEAGLRSFNKRMPEELNRIVCDHCSTWLFCPTDTAVNNLHREGFSTDVSHPPTMDHPHVVQCGDVMFDNTLHFATRAAERSTLLAHLGLEGKEYVLATVHRDANTDVGERLNAIFRALLELHRAHGLDVVLPLHPRTRKMMDSLLSPEVRQALLQTPGLHLIPPAGFLDMIALESNARLVLTDSGGVQKEAYFVGRPCVILRPETEWVELVERGQAVLADAEPERIRDAADRFLRDGAAPCPPLFGDGRAAEHICTQLLRFR